jgi:hypothetical protein
MLLTTEVHMESLMLLGGQFLQARIRDEYRRDRIVMAKRESAYWESLGALECGILAVYGVAARLLAAVVVLGILLTGLMAVAPAETGGHAFARSTPFKLAIWSESIGR